MTEYGLTIDKGICYAEDVLILSGFLLTRCKAFFVALFVSRFIIKGSFRLLSRAILTACWLAGFLVFWSSGKPDCQFAGILVFQQFFIGY